jgi:hypothetical protein
MRHCWLPLAACLAWAGADPEFQARREALAKALPDGVVVLHGQNESDAGRRNGFYQDSNFYYLTGWKAPGSALPIDPEREILFGAYIGGLDRPSLQKVAMDYVNSHGRDLHGEPLGKYFTHGIGHHIGLDVHDASDNRIPLEEGMVISVEPGIYIPEEDIGIRIEDMVVVTKDGARVMTAALPREAAEIEKATRK